jgi:hypothetical protein
MDIDDLKAQSKMALKLRTSPNFFAGRVGPAFAPPVGDCAPAVLFSLT